MTVSDALGIINISMSLVGFHGDNVMGFVEAGHEMTQRCNSLKQGHDCANCSTATAAQTGV